MNRHFTEEDAQMVNKHIKICSISLVIKEMQIKNMRRHYCAPKRIAKMKTVESPAVVRMPRNQKAHILLVEMYNENEDGI